MVGHYFLIYFENKSILFSSNPFSMVIKHSFKVIVFILLLDNNSSFIEILFAFQQRINLIENIDFNLNKQENIECHLTYGKCVYLVQDEKQHDLTSLNKLRKEKQHAFQIFFREGCFSDV